MLGHFCLYLSGGTGWGSKGRRHAAKTEVNTYIHQLSPVLLYWQYWLIGSVKHSDTNVSYLSSRNWATSSSTLSTLWCLSVAPTGASVCWWIIQTPEVLVACQASGPLCEPVIQAVGWSHVDKWISLWLWPCSLHRCKDSPWCSLAWSMAFYLFSFAVYWLYLPLDNAIILWSMPHGRVAAGTCSHHALVWTSLLVSCSVQSVDRMVDCYFSFSW